MSSPSGSRSRCVKTYAGIVYDHFSPVRSLCAAIHSYVVEPITSAPMPAMNSS